MPVEEPPVLITLSTIPSRMGAIEPCLRSLLSQAYPDFRVVLNLPETCLRTGEAYVLPPWLLELRDSEPRFNIVRVDEDYGPITKLVPALQAGWESLVAVCDDDHVYGPDWLGSLVKEHGALEGTAVVGFSGLVTDEEGQLWKYVGVDRPEPVLLTQGYTGYLFNARALGAADLLDAAAGIWELDPMARFVDDVVVGAFFDELKMPRFVVPQPDTASNASLHLGDSLDEDDMEYARAHGMSRHEQVIGKLRERGFFAGN